MNILTFDIEDWYCQDCETGNLDWDAFEPRIVEGVDRILDSLEDRKLKATFFILGWIAEHHPQVVAKISNAGHQIGCHTYQHKLLTSFTQKDFYADTAKAKDKIEQVIGKSISLFRAPAFSITEQNLFVFDVLAELGFTTDCSIFPAVRDYGGMPNYGIGEPGIIRYNGYQFKEFPINPANICGKKLVFSGGGYFRLFPYKAIKHLTSHQDYTMTYFHPRDFDPHQPIMTHLPIMRRWKNSVGLKKAYQKYLQYISDFDFISVEQADKLIDWNNCKTITLQ